jgi:polyphosphate kinase 2 (PPK2 family)
VRQQFKQINAFEELIHESGTAILKFFLHISKEEQEEPAWLGLTKEARP